MCLRWKVSQHVPLVDRILHCLRVLLGVSVAYLDGS